MSRNSTLGWRSPRRSPRRWAALAVALAVGLADGAVADGTVADGADEPAAGAKVFAGRCAVCHGSEAAGIPGSFPSLREQIAAFAATPAGRDYLVMVVTTGLLGEIKVAGNTYRAIMPAQSGLSDAQIAAVLSFLAGNRGRDAAAPALGATDVIEARARHTERSPLATRALRPAFPEQ